MSDINTDSYRYENDYIGKYCVSNLLDTLLTEDLKDRNKRYRNNDTLSYKGAQDAEKEKLLSNEKY